MIREMRKKDRELNKDEAEKVLEENTYGILSTVGEDGYPYGVPISYALFNNSIYIHSALEGHKLDNIRFNSKVSFTVVGTTEVLPEQFSTNFESVIVFGEATEVFGEEKYDALLKLINKYSPDFIEQGKAYIEKAGKGTRAVKIEIEHVTGKKRM